MTNPEINFYDPQRYDADGKSKNQTMETPPVEDGGLDSFENGIPNPESEIHIESEKIASEKLQRLLDPNLKTYGVRFMNIGEYEEILRDKTSSGEVYIVKDRLFREYLKEGNRTDWSHRAEAQTNWHASTFNIFEYNYLKNLLKGSHRSVQHSEKQNDTQPESYRERVLDYFKESVIQFANRSPENNIHWMISYANDLENMNQKNEELESYLSSNLGDEACQRLIHEIENPTESEYRNSGTLMIVKHNIEKVITHEDGRFEDICKAGYLLSEQINIIKRYGEENLRIVAEWLKNPNYLDGKDNLRKVMWALSTAPSVDEDPEARQYHLAVIYGIDALSPGDSGWGMGWQNINENRSQRNSTEEQSVLAQQMLGAISVMPDKQLYQRMSELSASAGDFSHPVFDSLGYVRWPKNKGEEGQEDITSDHQG